jgi:hypothetical protein
MRDFANIRDTLIRPAMEEIGNHAQLRGISFRISSQDEVPPDPRHGGGRDASIAIIFFPGGEKHSDHEFPAFTVFCNKHKQRAIFHDRTMMPGRGGS